jgi:hypothetical protein
MLLACIGKTGNLIWDTTFTTAYNVAISHLLYSGSGEFLAMGSAKADSAVSGSSGLLFIRFDTTGKVLTRKDLTDTYFMAANDIAVDGQGYIYLPLTRRSGSAKQKASVARYSGTFQKIWETELYNNPDFGAAPLALIKDESGNLYLSGKTELSQLSGTMDNSFLASLTATGTLRWKKYLEQYNSGVGLVMNKLQIIMLNRNCFFLNKAEPADGAEAGLFNVFSSCDQKNTDAFGMGIDVDYEGNFLLSGSKGGNYFLALKTIKQ